MSKKKTGILSFGAIYLQFEKYGFPPLTSIKPDVEIVGRDYDIVPAGSAVTLARVCTSLGLDSIFIGKTGTDEPGEITEKLLLKEGLKPVLITDPSVKTNIVDINICADGTAFQDVVGTANQSLSPQDIHSAFNQHIAEVSYLYLGGCFKMKAFYKHYRDYIAKAQQHKVKVILNHGRITNQVGLEAIILMRDLIVMADIYIASKEELLAITESEKIEDAFSKIKLHKNLTIITDGANGSYALQNGSLLQVPAFKVRVINSVTAGDSFNAGFIKAQSENLSLKDSLAYANVCAAIKISQRGLPTTDKINKLLNL